MSDRYPRLASSTVGLPAGDVVTQEDREPSQGPAGTGQGSNDRNERLLPNLFPQGEGYLRRRTGIEPPTDSRWRVLVLKTLDVGVGWSVEY